MAEQDQITWEDHDEGMEGWFQSACGRFEVRMDPVYGYHTLHMDGDCDSMGESRSLSELTVFAQQALAAEAA